MSEKLLSAGNLSVLAVSTNQSKWDNKHATIPDLRLSGEGVDERRKYRVCKTGQPVWAEHFMDCVGSLVLAANSSLMTHHFGDYLVEKGEVFQAIGDVRRATQQVGGGVAVIWRKGFTDSVQDRPYKQASELWSKMLSGLYVELALAVYDLVFSEWEWPLSSYYDGEQTLTLAANTEDYEKLLHPTITHLK